MTDLSITIKWEFVSSKINELKETNNEFLGKNHRQRHDKRNESI